MQEDYCHKIRLFEELFGGTRQRFSDRRIVCVRNLFQRRRRYDGINAKKEEKFSLYDTIVSYFFSEAFTKLTFLEEINAKDEQ